ALERSNMPFDITESFILDAEREIGAALPSAYRTSMLGANGGEIETEDDSWELYPIADTSDRKRLSRTANHIIKETSLCRAWPGFPENALAIASNGGGDRLVLLKQGPVFGAAVYAWSHETAALTKVANEFSALRAL
ncbi:SMI1/KNR4 family protein, partial [Roseateles oligotrophus]